MTVSSATNRKEYAGNGATTAFATSPVVFFATTDLAVYVVVDATGVATLKTITTHYTVSGGAGDVGTVTMITAPATGETLVIVRDVPATQGSDLVNNNGSDAEVVEDALDRLTMLAAQNEAAIDRALRLTDSDISGVDMTITGLEAGNLIAVNSAGTGLEPKTPTSLSLVAVSAFINTLIDDTTAAIARATLLIETKSTVASATTPDIWTGTGHLIDYTGTATATGFAAAPQAGAARELLCAGAAVFTNGANFVVAGGSFTAAAGDRILVVAETTTKFLLFPIKADGKAVVASVAAATQAEMETGTSTTTYVSPGRQHFHPGHPKCFAEVEVSAGTPTLETAYNITSITDSATGRLTITIATDFSTDIWCCPTGQQRASTALAVANDRKVCVENAGMTEGSVILECFDSTAVTMLLKDPEVWSMAGLGDQV